MRIRRFEHGGTKFWTIQTHGSETIVTFGKLGTDGQTQIKSHPSASAAARVAEKLIEQKTKKGYEEVTGKPIAARPPKPRTAKDEIAALAPALADSVEPYVRIVAKKRRGALPLWASKACDGRPYLPLKTPWPKARGRILLPVMQIDLAEVPALPGFPRKGLLGLFWSEDYQDRKLFYWPQIVRDESKLWSADASAEMIGDATLYPYEAPVVLSFEKREGCVSWGDYRFAELVGGKTVVERLWESPHQSKIWDHVWKWSGGADTRLGGYANPQQSDPRERSKYRAYETQLLQIQNDNFTHNIFIKPADLRRADFSDVLFYEACD